MLRKRIGHSDRPPAVTWESATLTSNPGSYVVVLPAPESTNAIWRQWKGRTITSKKHRADKAKAPGRFGPVPPLTGDLVVRLLWVRAEADGDVDGRIKATLDLLTLIGVWDDDKQVSDLRVIRSDDQTKAPGMYCWITRVNEQQEAA